MNPAQNDTGMMCMIKVLKLMAAYKVKLICMLKANLVSGQFLVTLKSLPQETIT